MAGIEVRQLTYSYPESRNRALADLNLQVSEAELVLVAGCSGSGKSTLLRALNGLVPSFYGGRFAGRVVVAGMDTRRATPVELAGRVGFVFQEPESRFITGSVADEIAFGMEVAGLPGEVIRERLEEIIERLELGPLVDRPLDRLSGGEQQRVAVAAALGRRPPILLLDEPTSQLDSTSAEEVVRWIVELRQEFGLTTLVAEHRLGRLGPRVDRILYLPGRGGEASYGRPADVLAQMPYGPPLAEARRLLGMPPGWGAAAERELQSRLEQLGPVAARPAPAAPSRLIAEGLSYAYNGVPALNDACLDVRPGEVVAVLGRNGSGKTTLLRCVMGLLNPGAGKVWLEGQEVSDRSVVERAKAMAYVPQWPESLLFADTVREELELTLRNHGLQGQPPVDPEALLADLGLGDVAERYPRDLSAGERQRAAVAAVLVTRPSVLLLDEPTLGIDPMAQAAFGELLERWRGDGMAIVLATHDVEFAAAHADRAVVLDRGRVVAAGTTAETLYSQSLLRTALQKLTGRPRPASVATLAAK